MFVSRSLVLVAALFAYLSAAQQSGWDPNQVNTTMCYWTTPRAAVIRDTLYIDGGYLWWQPGMNDGTYGPLIGDGNPLGIVYLLNFSTPFQTSDNLTAIFNTTSKAPNGGNVNNIGPQYYDGTMMANDYEWFTYGGLLLDTDSHTPPSSDSVAAYEQYESGPSRQFAQGYTLDHLPSGMTRYVTYGAGVSVPSENLGFYFAGLRAADYGPIYLDTSNETLNADALSTNLIQLDMSVQQQETWSNNSLPPTVPGRASAEIVWVPVSEQGILIAIGGVINPVYVNPNETNTAAENKVSTDESPAFMSNVSVYDIASQTWYEQPTSGSPGQLAQGCTVVAAAQDGSSYNIYWYGGFDGIHQNNASSFSDDVWILSVPSFMWMKVYSGNSSHARAGHRCAKPYPDQMLVVGGYGALVGNQQPPCVEGGIIQIFNLSSATWIDSYSPKLWSNYTVPDMIVNMIGGSPTGGATQTAPSPTGFAHSNLTSIFKTTYNATKITTWYPYQEATTAPTNRTTILPVPVSKSSGTPSYLAPVLGVVLGLFFLTLLILAFLLYRRHQYRKVRAATNPSEHDTMDNRFWVSNWLRGTPVDAKALTTTTDETPMTPFDDEAPNGGVGPYGNNMEMQEVANTQIHEMPDTSQAVELHDTGFVPIAPKTRVAALTSSPSNASRTSQGSSVVSGVSDRPAVSPVQRQSSQGSNKDREFSGVSNLSETDKGHLRGISETSISTDGHLSTPRELPAEASSSSVAADERPRVVSPLTPPAGVEASNDYIGAAAPSEGNPRRKSNFEERLEEED